MTWTRMPEGDLYGRGCLCGCHTRPPQEYGCPAGCCPVGALMLERFVGVQSRIVGMTAPPVIICDDICTTERPLSAADGVDKLRAETEGDG